MDYDTAKLLMEKVTSASAIFAELSRDIDKLEEPERTLFMRGLGHTMGEMHEALIRPIGKQFPDLDPSNS